jgi:uncharacterized surface protein with fasciclin (FAS1) repeats
MADEEQMQKPTTEGENADKGAGKNTLVIVVVAALLLIGGVFLLNRLTGSNENTADETTDQSENISEDTTNEVTDTTEEVVDETEQTVEETTETSEETASEAVLALKDKMGTMFTKENLVTLAAALKATKLEDALVQGGPYTILAPSEEAFKKLPAGTLESLLKDPEKLAQILKFHVINKKLMSDQIINGEEEKTLQGGTVVFTKDAKGNVTVNGAKVVKVDVDAANGVVHVVDTVLIPK